MSQVLEFSDFLSVCKTEVLQSWRQLEEGGSSGKTLLRNPGSIVLPRCQ